MSEPEPEREAAGGAYGAATRFLSGVMIVLGVVMIVTTLARGAGPTAVGVVFGVLFTAAGAARLYLAHRQAHDA
jgi:hypothetical protein